MACAGLGALAVVCVLEALLRLAPVSTGLRFQAVNAANPVLRGEPGLRFTKSMGWSLFNAQHGALNNYGFNSPRPYSATVPAIAVIGDSYVEATQAPAWATLPARLEQQTSGCAQVYGFGESGGALGDYLNLLGWTSRNFKLVGAVILITADDVRESTERRPGLANFTRGGADQVELRRQDYPGSTPTREVINGSRLFRYAFDNLQFDPRALAPVWPARHTTARESAAAQPTAGESIRAFTDGLARASPLRPRDIMILFDADRKAIYAGRPASADPDRRALMAAARQRGFGVVDLTGPFADGWRRTGRRLDYSPIDGHWNPVGYWFAAQATATEWRRSGADWMRPGCGALAGRRAAGTGEQSLVHGPGAA